MRDCVEVLGVKIDRLTLANLFERVEYFIAKGGHNKIMYVNVHCMNVVFKDKEYRHVLDTADMVYCDGAGVVLGARLLGQYLPGRMTGADWIYELCELCSQKGYSLFFLGGEPGVAEKAVVALISKYPKLKIAGVHHGYLKDDDNAQLIDLINAKRPDILLVGFGTPIQEKWIAENSAKLNVPVVWAVGAMLDFVSGKARRAPSLLLDNGMEWLFRFIMEPGRMWKSYLVGNSVFMLKIINQSALNWINK